ncbi:hypothetical protein JYU34_009300 [Plutella xylostella]|uniref:Uncharacterized protein n=1 Tax=Plutella xylostella TaxID=51655 RepID=A0ABQ7QJ61_PLUXY|nr:hypothetical protein JYU34_009300 [Plutella xylostella]
MHFAMLNIHRLLRRVQPIKTIAKSSRHQTGCFICKNITNTQWASPVAQWASTVAQWAALSPRVKRFRAAAIILSFGSERSSKFEDSMAREYSL